MYPKIYTPVYITYKKNDLWCEQWPALATSKPQVYAYYVENQSTLNWKQFFIEPYN